jgi:uncharacterized protein HemX
MDLKNGRTWLVALLAALALGLGVYFFASGDAAEAHRAVDRTADELTGGRAVRQGQEVKAELKSILGPRDELLRSTQGQ